MRENSFLIFMLAESAKQLNSPTNPYNGCEKSSEYYQLKAATLAREGQQVFIITIFAFHASKPFVQIAVIEIMIDRLLNYTAKSSLWKKLAPMTITQREGNRGQVWVISHLTGC